LHSLSPRSLFTVKWLLFREKLFLNQNKQGQVFRLIDPKNGQVTETKINDSIQYSGRHDEVSRIELVDKNGQVILYMVN
jgi:hypothetical protein